MQRIRCSPAGLRPAAAASQTSRQHYRLGSRRSPPALQQAEGLDDVAQLRLRSLKVLGRAAHEQGEHLALLHSDAGQVAELGRVDVKVQELDSLHLALALGDAAGVGQRVLGDGREQEQRHVLVLLHL